MTVAPAAPSSPRAPLAQGRAAQSRLQRRSSARNPVPPTILELEQTCVPRHRAGHVMGDLAGVGVTQVDQKVTLDAARSEEHTSELQSLMRISYAVFCLKKKTNHYMTNPPRSHSVTTH